VKGYQPVVAALLREKKPRRVLDAPSGSGWLAQLIDAEIDGLDLFGSRPEKYRSFRAADLDQGLPDDLGGYDAVVCCEGLEHFGNPDLFLRSAFRHLNPGGVLIVTTPNVWYPEARLQYLLRGFFPSFPSLAGKIKRGTHMHIMPWSFPQLFLYLRLAGFGEVRLHDVDEPKPKRLYEWLLAWPQALYCWSKKRKTAGEERDYWQQAGSRQSLFGRRLVVSAIRA
jgi:SAM-dependent methyltransferase